MSEKERNKKKHKIDWLSLLPLSIPVSAFLFILLLVIVVTTDVCNPNTKFFIPGNPKKFDPIKALLKVKKFAGKDVNLLSINAIFIKSDGTLNLLSSYQPYVIYTFVRSINEVKYLGKNGPKGSGLKQRQINYKSEIITVRISKSPIGKVAINSGMVKGIAKQENEPDKSKIVSDPKSFKKIWDKARLKDAPPDAVAIISYSHMGYDFRILGTNIHYKFTE